MARKQFFNLRYPKLELPIWMDQLGTVIETAGLILQGNGATVLLMLPGKQLPLPMDQAFHQEWINDTTVEDWAAVLKQLDDPEIFELDSSGATKAVHRKNMRQVGAALQWEVYHRDNYQCKYCGRKGGTNGVSLSVDHFVPVEHGGTDEKKNLVTACRRCNKDKGNQMPVDYLDFDHYLQLSQYLENVP